MGVFKEERQGKCMATLGAWDVAKKENRHHRRNGSCRKTFDGKDWYGNRLIWTVGRKGKWARTALARVTGLGGKNKRA